MLQNRVVESFALFGLLLGLSSCVAAAGFTAEQQTQAEHWQRQQLERQMQPQADGRLNEAATQQTGAFSLALSIAPCFVVQEIRLEGDKAARFQFALKHAIAESGFTSGMCLSAQGIDHITALAQNAVIAKGYTTTRILAAPQDLNSGILTLTVISGRVTAFQNEFPVSGGQILNL